MFDAPPPSERRAPEEAALHVLQIIARSRRVALLAAEDLLGSTDAELCRLSLKPVGEIVEATLKLRGLDEGAAQRLADRAGGYLGVTSARVEHQWALP